MKQGFNVRVYGLLINEHDEILISDEFEFGRNFTQFPGGGLEFGEGLIDGLKREYMEECFAKIEVLEHFYTTDFFVKSAFNDTQVINVYYFVKNVTPLDLNFKLIPYDFDGEGDVLQSFRWIKMSELKVDDVTFPIERHVVKLLIERK